MDFESCNPAAQFAIQQSQNSFVIPNATPFIEFGLNMLATGHVGPTIRIFDVTQPLSFAVFNRVQRKWPVISKSDKIRAQKVRNVQHPLGVTFKLPLLSSPKCPKWLDVQNDWPDFQRYLMSLFCIKAWKLEGCDCYANLRSGLQWCMEVEEHLGKYKIPNLHLVATHDGLQYL